MTGFADGDEVGHDGSAATAQLYQVVNIVVHLRIGLHVLRLLAEDTLKLVATANGGGHGSPVLAVRVSLDLGDSA
jgi:hypothetical protein